jgi:multidrug resistance protein
MDLEKGSTRDNGTADGGSPDMSVATMEELKTAAESPVAGIEMKTLSRIESATSAAFDPASRVPTNASRESGVIGIYPLQLICGLPFVVIFMLMFAGWDGENDPENPRNWPLWRKGIAVGVISSITFLSPLASSMFAPGIPTVMSTFGTTNTSIGSFTVSVYILGFAAGPLLWAPLSEMYGRAPVFNVTNVGFVAFNIGCGFANSIAALILLRFFAGFCGSACLALGGGVIADMIAPDQRGKATSIWSIGPLMGPVIGPICGGFMSQRIGWRWIFYVLSIAGGFVGTGTFIFLKETNPVVILERKAARLRKETGNHNLRSALESNVTGWQLLVLSLKRPFKLLFISPIVLSLSLLMGVNYAYLYLCFTTFPLVFQEVYHFSEGISGLAYLGLGLGSIIGLAIIGKYSDKIVVRMTQKNGVRKPEYRLPFMIAAHLFIPIGLFWYGWSADKHAPW